MAIQKRVYVGNIDIAAKNEPFPFKLMQGSSDTVLRLFVTDNGNSVAIDNSMHPIGKIDYGNGKYSDLKFTVNDALGCIEHEVDGSKLTYIPGIYKLSVSIEDDLDTIMVTEFVEVEIEHNPFFDNTSKLIDPQGNYNRFQDTLEKMKTEFFQKPATIDQVRSGDDVFQYVNPLVLNNVLNEYQKAENGKGLSENNFTDALKDKLDALQACIQNPEQCSKDSYITPDSLSLFFSSMSTQQPLGDDGVDGKVKEGTSFFQDDDAKCVSSRGYPVQHHGSLFVLRNMQIYLDRTSYEMWVRELNSAKSWDPWRLMGDKNKNTGDAIMINFRYKQFFSDAAQKLYYRPESWKNRFKTIITSDGVYRVTGTTYMKGEPLVQHGSRAIVFLDGKGYSIPNNGVRLQYGEYVLTYTFVLKIDKPNTELDIRIVNYDSDTFVKESLIGRESVVEINKIQ